MIPVEKYAAEADKIDWLEGLLKSHGSMLRETIFEEGAKLGFSRQSIKNARRFEGPRIVAREGFWIWRG